MTCQPLSCSEKVKGEKQLFWCPQVGGKTWMDAEAREKSWSEPTQRQMRLGGWDQSRKLVQNLYYREWEAFPGGPVVNTWQCRAPRLDPWSRRTTCHSEAKPTGHSNWVHVPRAHVPQREKPLKWEAHARQLQNKPHSPQLEKAHMQQQRPITVKKKIKRKKMENVRNVWEFCITELLIEVTSEEWFRVEAIIFFLLVIKIFYNEHAFVHCKYV